MQISSYAPGSPRTFRGRLSLFNLISNKIPADVRGCSKPNVTATGGALLCLCNSQVWLSESERHNVVAYCARTQVVGGASRSPLLLVATSSGRGLCVFARHQANWSLFFFFFFFPDTDFFCFFSGRCETVGPVPPPVTAFPDVPRAAGVAVHCEARTEQSLAASLAAGSAQCRHSGCGPHFPHD